MNDEQEEAKNDAAWEMDAANDKTANPPRRKLFVRFDKFSLVFLSLGGPYTVYKQYALSHRIGLTFVTALIIGWLMLSIYKRLQQEG